MILTGVVVFLFGTAVSAGPYIPRVKAAEIVMSKHSSADKVTEYYPSSGGSPFISNFVQKGTNVFFKPQFMLSSGQNTQPQIQTVIGAVEKDDCKTSLPMEPIPMLLEEPLRVVQQEFVASSEPIVKEVIEINPVEYNHHIKPTLELMPAISPVQEVHVLESPERPLVFEESIKRPYMPYDKPREIVTEVVISPAPKLPEVQLPKLPMLVEEMSVTHVNENTYLEPVAIPAAPLLPPLEMPEVPVVVEESSIVVEEKPMVVPEAPVLPPLSLPEHPVMLEVGGVEEVVAYETVELQEPLLISEPIRKPTSVLVQEPVTVEIQKPLVIPSAPVLPPLDIPKSPVIIEETVVSRPSGNAFEHPKVLIESRPNVLPVPAFPKLFISNTQVSKPTISTEFLTSYFPVVEKEEPVPCVHDVLVEGKIPAPAYLAPFRYAPFY